MMKNITTLILLLSLIVSNTMMAIPAKPISRTFIQPDGSKLTIILQGDEHFSYYSTIDKVMLATDKEGYMRYAVPTTNNEFIPGKFIARNPEERNVEVKTYIKEKITDKMNIVLQKEHSSNKINKMSGAIGASEFPTKGNVKGLIIMAEFKDQKFSNVGTQEEISRMMNEEGYKNYNATGSARDYFVAQSNQTFFPSFDVVGPVTLPQNMEYYGKRIGNSPDQDPAQMIVDACKQAKSQYGVDFSQYDLDDNGRVDLIYVIYAGYGEAKGAPSYTIWPHAWDILYGDKTLILDGKHIRDYACSSELNGSSGTEIDGIGTFCHEFSHCLGIPDLYDSQGRGGYGLGYWSVMDRGCYNNDGKTPPSYSAFERYSVSWLNPEYLETPEKNITLEALDLSNKAYFIKSDLNKNEYYILENRQPNNWDKYLPGHGLMITHVNYNVDNWTNNTVNSPSGQERVQIVPADNILSLQSVDKDAFPGPIGNTSFTDISVPAALLASGGYLNKPITNITETDGLISFNYGSYPCIPPVLKNPTNILRDGFTAEWEAVTGASSYILEVSPRTTGQLLLEEDFSGFKAGAENKPDEDNISTDLNKYTKIEGWSGNEIYQAGGSCSIGITDRNGSLTTPLIDLTANDTFTLCLELKGSVALSSGIQLGWSEIAQSSEYFATKQFDLPNTSEKIYWVFNADEAKGHLEIKINAQVNLKSIKIYTGDVKDDLMSNTLPSFEGKEKKQTIADLTSTTYKVTGLNKLSPYYYSVSTIMNEELSIPSKKMAVTTISDSSIGQMAVESQVYVSGNHLFIYAEEGEQIQIYTIDGLLKYSFKAKDGVNSLQVENGIYIIHTSQKSLKATVMN